MPETRFQALSDGARHLIWGMRHWMVALLRNESVPLSVTRAFARGRGFGAIAALAVLAARDADRPLRVLPPCGEVSDDEQRIASALDCVRNGAAFGANEHLRALIGGPPSKALIARFREIAMGLGSMTSNVSTWGRSCDR